MTEMNGVSTAVESENSGKIVFADDVIATIAALAAADVEGVAGMSGGVVEGLTERLGMKNITKGVKVEVGTEEAAVDVFVNVRYGFRIQEVCQNLQKAIKSAIETMTGLRVVEVNAYVQAVVFDTPESAEDSKKKAKKDNVEETEEIPEAETEPEPPRVK